MDKGESAKIVNNTNGLDGHRLGKGRGGTPQDKDGQGLGRAVSMRLEDGNFKGAVRLLSSEDVLAKTSIETLRALQDKHPSTPLDRRTAPSSTSSTPPVSFVEAVVRKPILSFPPPVLPEDPMV